jgi:predicted nucleotidyltransferase component of viral defense system
VSRLTPGHIARHTPRGSGGREAAIIDIAQDILLTHLAGQGMFDLLVFKGGTALRKVYAGTAGRFSTDLDFSLAGMSDDRESVTALLVDAIDGYKTDDFSYRVTEQRGKFQVHYTSRFGDVSHLSTKLDVGPPVWMPPVERPWVEAAIHQYYELPAAIPTMALEENLAEKITRLNRRRLARDLYDLWWVGSSPPHSAFNEYLVNQLVALKCWVDTYGLNLPSSGWIPVDGATAFDPARWLTEVAAIDDESIGLLMNPPPDLPAIQADVIKRYRFLRSVPPEVAQATARDRRALGDVHALLKLLPGGRFSDDLAVY